MPKIPTTKPTTRATRTPRVSVLMSAYNSEKYIAAAIESILTQTFTDFEFVIINDGSTDRTPEIIAEYAARDKRIKFIDNRINAGLIAALNQGLDFCRGEYIARMDSDDISLPTRFQIQTEYLDAHPECGVVGAWIKCFWNNGNTKTNRYPEKVSLLDMVASNPIANPVSMIRRKILSDKNFKYNPEFVAAEDYAMWTELIFLCEIHNLQSVLLEYRCHNNNISVRMNETQSKNTKIISDGILNKISDVPQIQKRLRKIAKTMHFYKQDSLTLRDFLHHPFRTIRILIDKQMASY